MTNRSGPTESCHSFFKHFRVQFYMTDREIINIKVSVKTFSNGTPRLGWKFCFYPAMCFYFLLNYFQWSLTCLSGLGERAHSDSVIVKDTQYLQYIINRGYYMAARRYEISLRVLKNISRVSAANTNEIPNHFTFIVFWCERRDLLCSHNKGDIFTCEDNMLFSHVKISSFRAKAHLVFH